MNRTELTKLISEQYGADPEYLFRDDPYTAVFRHSNNRKWFAIIMKIHKDKLDRRSPELVDVVNFKADPFFIGSLLGTSGLFPAYHMNKTHWITAVLDGSASDDDILTLLDMSFDLTGVKNSSRKKL